MSADMFVNYFKRKKEMKNKVKVVISVLSNYIENRVYPNLNTIFKSSIFLLGLSLLGMSQTMPIIIDTDYRIKKSAFEIEVQEGKQLEDIDCNSIQLNKSKCFFTQYQQKSNSSALKFTLNWIIIPSLIAGCFLLVISILFFLNKEEEELKRISKLIKSG